MNGTTATQPMRGGIEIIAPWGEKAELELGMGCNPQDYGDQIEAQFRDECGYGAKIRIVEEAIWTVDFPILDDEMSTFGPTINVFGTPDGNPPPGVTTATNTLATPNLPPNNMIVRGIWFAIRVEPEARTIRTNVLSTAGLTTMPVSPDVFTQNDITNNALGLGTGQSIIAADLLHGLPTWRFAYQCIKAYELVWAKNHQERMIQQPLESVANIQPFAQSEAAGIAFASNADIINLANQRMAQLGFPNEQYLPITHKRVGSANQGTGSANVGIFTPTREEDAAPTIFGGIGVPYGPIEKAPYMFTTPIWWPAGRTMSLFLQLANQEEQATMQRWLSITGGAGGTPGNDQNLNPSSGNPTLLGPLTATGATVGLEMTLDPIPAFVSQQVNINRWLGKSGRAVMAMGVIGRRVTNESWLPIVAQFVQKGAIACPQGYGDLGRFMQAA